MILNGIFNFLTMTHGYYCTVKYNSQSCVIMQMKSHETPEIPEIKLAF